MGTKAFICVPIVSSDKTLGVLAVDNMATKRPLLQSDLDLLLRMAPEIGMAMRMAWPQKTRSANSTRYSRPLPRQSMPATLYRWPFGEGYPFFRRYRPGNALSHEDGGDDQGCGSASRLREDRNSGRDSQEARANLTMRNMTKSRHMQRKQNRY